MATLDVELGSEDGLLGLALDPGFNSNRWIYFFYTPAGEESIQRISRFHLLGDSLLLTTEKVLLEFPLIRRVSHSAGSLEFGPEGNLFISVGDNTSPFESRGYAPIDERTGREKFDAQKSAANTNDLRGKILRITPQKDGTYKIPDGNLFPKDGSKGRPEIYVMGNRNPYRISIDQHTGYLYWGEIGPDAGKEDSLKGSMEYDEINQARKPGNFGWPYFVGDIRPYRDYDFKDSISGEYFDPQHPINQSINNTGESILPPATPAFIWYPYNETEVFPELGKGGRSAMAGPVFYSRMFKGSDYAFPGYFNGKLFIYEWMRDLVMLVTMDENGNYNKMERFLPTYPFAKPIDMQFGKDGSLYILEYGQYWRSHNADSRLIRIRYHEGNRQPIAKISANKLVGACPLTIEFSGEGSFDYDEHDSLVYEWSFEGDVIQSSVENPSYTFSKPGIYTVKLKVTDISGISSDAIVEVHAGNEPPKIEIRLDKNSSFYWGKEQFSYEILIEDLEDGNTKEGGIKSEEVVIKFDYAGALANGFLEGLSLIESSDCKSCHDYTKRSVGPAYIEVARRYNGNDVRDMLVGKVIEGGNGQWGEVPMSAHPQLSKEKVGQMIDYILSLRDEVSNKNLALSGILKTDQHTKEEMGVYKLVATYVDREISGINGRQVSTAVTLRPSTLLAVNCDDYEKVILIRDQDRLRFIDDESWFKFNQIDLQSISGIRLHVASTERYEGEIELHVDSPNGQLIGKILVEKGIDEFLLMDISEMNETHDLYFLFKTQSDKINSWTTVDIYSMEFKRQ